MVPTMRDRNGLGVELSNKTTVLLGFEFSSMLTDSRSPPCYRGGVDQEFKLVYIQALKTSAKIIVKSVAA